MCTEASSMSERGAGEVIRSHFKQTIPVSAYNDYRPHTLASVVILNLSPGETKSFHHFKNTDFQYREFSDSTRPNLLSQLLI